MEYSGLKKGENDDTCSNNRRILMTLCYVMSGTNVAESDGGGDRTEFFLKLRDQEISSERVTFWFRPR